MAVGGDVLVVVAGDLDRGLQLLERVLDRSRVLCLRGQHRPGGHDLDQVGAVGELAASRGADRVGAIGDLVHARVVVDGRCRDRQQLAGEEHPRPAERARRDRITDVHLDVVPTADVAHGRDPGRDGALGGGRGVQRDGGVGSARRLRRVAGIGRLREVDVTVDESRQQPGTLDVDDVIAGPRSSCVDDRRDPVTVDSDVGPPKRFGADVVDLSTHQPPHARQPYARPIATRIQTSESAPGVALIDCPKGAPRVTSSGMTIRSPVGCGPS